jgi:hypothetical protein
MIVETIRHKELGLKSTPKKRIKLFMRYLDYEQGSLSLDQHIQYLLCCRFKKSADKIVENPLKEVGLKFSAGKPFRESLQC